MFLDFCENVAPFTYGQHLQDAFCLWQSGLKPTGYFVEFGALNGVNVSNTYLLEVLGWKGIVAEPHPSYAQLLNSNRNCHVSTDCVWKKSGEQIKFNAVKGKPALSTIAGIEYDDVQDAAGARDEYVEHMVQSITLVDLLDRFTAPQYIDCLSIDTEGSELDILEVFDFSRYTFGTIVVEHGFSSKREPLFELLSQNGYGRKWKHISGHDDWYVHASYAELADGNLQKQRELILQMQGLQKSPDLWRRLRQLKVMAGNCNQQHRVLRLAERIAREIPDHGVVQSEYANALAKAGLVTEALERYERALSLSPDLKVTRNQYEALKSNT